MTAGPHPTDLDSIIYGPAYLDRVLRVDRPLLPDRSGPPLDRSVVGKLVGPGDGIVLVDDSGRRLSIEPPPGWPGPLGTILLTTRLGDLSDTWSRSIGSVAWQDDLGGMGAGYAAALGGTLVSALGAEDDPINRDVEGLLKRYGVVARPVRIANRPADWTLLVTSGPHGDKLPIGFRGCHEGWAAGPDTEVEPCFLRVVAGLPNPLAARILEAPGAGVRLFAPAARNMAASPSIASFARSIDLLSCNRGEWETLSEGDRGEILGAVPVVVVTDGAAGCTVWFHGAEEGRLSFPVFPRTQPPEDTNRAGETFASTFLRVLLGGGWRPGPVAPDLIAIAANRASAAAALVLDLRDFGFPTAAEIDAALARGFVGPSPSSAEEL